MKGGQMKINKLPWFKFYPKDWMTDSGLRLCSWDTKGVYIDLLCIMAESNRYGYLEINDNNNNKLLGNVRVGLQAELR